jgi:hypothetical protein
MTERDALANVHMTCPLCRRWLRTNRPKYGWGSMGAQLKCDSCGLEVRLPWSPLRRAVLKEGKRRVNARQKEQTA